MANPKPVHSHELFNQLANFIAFPPNVRSAVVKLGLDAPAEVECTYYAPVEIDITKLSSFAREFEAQQQPVTKRYRLVEIEEGK